MREEDRGTVKGSVLIAGFATRHVAQSAFRAGYRVCAVDHFCDLDLAWYTDDRIRFGELEEIAPAVEEMCCRHPFDLLVLTSGAEEIAAAVPLYGTPKEKVARFLDKLGIQRFFEALPVPVPPLAREGEYPAMIKPRCGSGGWRNRILRSDVERRAWEAEFGGMPAITQKLVQGIPASVCCFADGNRAVAVAVNEQLLRGEGPGMFGFCGSVTPFDHPIRERMIRYAGQIAAGSGCTGTVGIDFVLGDEAWAIEINPRFQGTLDTVEMATGLNLFGAHVDACRGILPAPMPRPMQYAVRTILFADRDLTIRRDPAPLAPAVADIPPEGTFIEEGKAIVSVYGWGPDRNAALTLLDKNITRVNQYVR
jgi:predicted ATP-grasp superfamily ATP-dependent carboligase